MLASSNPLHPSLLRRDSLRFGSSAPEMKQDCGIVRLPWRRRYPNLALQKAIARGFLEFARTVRSPCSGCLWNRIRGFRHPWIRLRLPIALRFLACEGVKLLWFRKTQVNEWTRHGRDFPLPPKQPRQPAPVAVTYLRPPLQFATQLSPVLQPSP